MNKLNETIGRIKSPDKSTYEQALKKLSEQARPAGLPWCS